MRLLLAQVCFLGMFMAPSLESGGGTYPEHGPRSAHSAPHPQEPWQRRGLDVWGGHLSCAPVGGGLGRRCGGLPCRPLRSRCHTAGGERQDSQHP